MDNCCVSIRSTPPDRSRLGVGSVTTSESLVLYVFAPFCSPFFV